ncbi:AraC family transcriptional regulator of adaptative response/methylated-DNA-[protein]-cysteine methyltransferase [Chryseobacterium bernardetii]|uniref:methylated-DNA--[protein]-cysteine S-methyltransferase n=3 Tax=Chryseobacterium group TaxID=2782232 RepID=A0A543EML1_9FLAO|nr:AraC family transcriptional regulator of adaptative response/methylated-DNA-[protein]-cysteine methyltransferase [Chryseobacterium vietnamense]MDR6439873.1 AraC family transcriptional regulator of adaptative response/methylated-DNA-[protein]-cysteine methyltransferase [Chryseobacterium bernardetii]TQM22808.1 AraC family transcriptional regulator of adaptative response/methylated-DNA-[protein]-cysteine methyltransferase [Chryseobacterium aquifrigidense]
MMSTQSQIDYNRIAKAIEYIQRNFRLQPSLEEVAENIHLSPAHFQKIFTDWAGTSPKKFLQFISLEHAKNLLKEEKASLFDTAYETGFSSTSRLHDLFVKIEGMSPAEYKNGGKSLNIHYSFSESPFGTLLAASTEKGICYMAFEDDKEKAFGELKQKFPNASFIEKQDALQKNALSIFDKDWTQLNTIKLHLKGTDFQLKVWESLLTIPMGKLSTYGTLAEKIGNPKAYRAVGTAIGSNPVAFLIPCHRVIQSTGHLGGYRWGSDRKQLIVGWEGSHIYS